MEKTCPSSNALRQLPGDLAEALAHLVSSLSGFDLMLQAALPDGVAFDPFSHVEDFLAAPEVRFNKTRQWIV